jgi:hypothetical protein
VCALKARRCVGLKLKYVLAITFTFYSEEDLKPNASELLLK